MDSAPFENVFLLEVFLRMNLYSKFKNDNKIEEVFFLKAEGKYMGIVSTNPAWDEP